MSDIGVDPFLLVPRWSASDALRVLAWFVALSCLPGWALVRLASWRVACRAERWALTGILGVLWTSGCLFVVGLSRMPAWHAPLALTPVIVAAAIWARRWARCQARIHLSWPRFSRGEAMGLLLIGLLAAWHVARVAQGVQADESGVRFHGAWHSDKFVNMSVAASLMHETPPRSLRMSGEGFPYHFFPHIWIAGAARATGVNYVNVFWFHASAIGIVLAGLAALAFARRMLSSYDWAMLGLLFYGLAQFTTEARPLDLSISLLLLGALALQRWTSGRRARWGVLAAICFGAMPLYEVFHALTGLMGLGLWWAFSAIKTWRLPSRDIVPIAQRTAFVVVAGMLALGSVSLTTWGVEPAGQTKFVFKSSYRDSYKHEWLAAIQSSGEQPSVVRTIYAWKRGKAALPSAAGADAGVPARAHWTQRAAAEVIYFVGFLAYVFFRWINLSVLGIAALWIAFRRVRTRSAETLAVVAAIAAVGFALPCLFTWGHEAGGRWWETPNIYRPTTVAYLLLMLVGVGTIRMAVDRWRRPVSWLALIGVAWQLIVLCGAAVAPQHAYHHVGYDQLAALAYLRQHAPPDEVAIHPWTDELIHDARTPERVDWVYKRHFTLGSNLTGRAMYYEGREDHLFIGGFIDPEAVYRRRELRRQFYDAPSPETVQAVVRDGGVCWVIADADFPAPAVIRETWPVVFTSHGVAIHRAPSSHGPPRGASIPAVAASAVCARTN